MGTPTIDRQLALPRDLQRNWRSSAHHAGSRSDSAAVTLASTNAAACGAGSCAIAFDCTVCRRYDAGRVN